MKRRLLISISALLLALSGCASQKAEHVSAVGYFFLDIFSGSQNIWITETGKLYIQVMPYGAQPEIRKIGVVPKETFENITKLISVVDLSHAVVMSNKKQNDDEDVGDPAFNTLYVKMSSGREMKTEFVGGISSPQVNQVMQEMNKIINNAKDLKIVFKGQPKSEWNPMEM